MEAVAPLAVAGPFLVAALLAASLPLERVHNDLIGVVTASAATIFAALLLADAAGAGAPLVTWLGGWEPRDGVALGISLAIDPLGAGLALLAALLVTAAFAVAWRYFDTVGRIFHALMLVFLGAMAGFCLTGDLFNMFVFFELMSVSAFALTSYRIEESAPLQGALNFAVTNSVGAVMVLTGIGLLYGRTGALNLAQVGEALAAQPADGLVICAFALITGGFLVKAAVVPFHFWLADAYTVAPTPACIVFSGVMSDLGLYAVARIYWTVFEGPLGEHAPSLRAILVAAGVLTALVGAAMCLVQRRLKRLLAFVTVSQIGLALIAIGLLSPAGLAGATLLIGADGLLRAALFVGLGAILHRLGSGDELRLRGAGGQLPWPVGALFAAAAVGLAALPPLGAFHGHALVEEAAHDSGYGWVAVVFLTATIATAGALLRAAARIFLGMGEARALEPEAEPEEDEIAAARGFTPVVMIWTAGVLTTLGLALGAVPGIGDAALRAAERFADREHYTAAVLGGPDRPVPAGQAAGVGLVEVLLALVTVLGALALAGWVLSRRRAWLAVPASLRPRLERGLLVLRRLHSGQVGDYVAWLTVGMAVLGGLLALATA
jgi:multicomponent Na+:H+ antiporter subunit D